MSKTLVIVESPSKCKKIEDYLGKDKYKCMASYGHIREMKTKLGLGCIDLQTFNVTYQNVFRQLKHIQSLQKEIKRSREVIIATDDDREGEAIGWHICQVFDLSVTSTKRIIFHEITEPAIKKAISNPIHINMDMVLSQQSRQIIDLIVGYSISPLLWKYIQFGKSTLSAGRCQTPALRVIYDNHIEIEKNKAEFIHSIYGEFNDHKYQLNKSFIHNDDVKSFISSSIHHVHIIDNKSEKETVKTPPQPFITSSLQQKSHSRLNYSPKTTMMLCQNLYEAGYITYMRTDNKKYSVEFIDKTTAFICQSYGSKYSNTNLDNITLGVSEDKDEGSQEAHEAIRPTDISLDKLVLNGKITSKEERLYKLIRNNTLESCMTNAIYKRFNSVIKTVNDLQYESVLFKQMFQGWQLVDNIDDSNSNYDSIISLTNKSNVQFQHIWSSFNITNNKQHINESKLVSILEKNGIGRPSTFSSIISKIQERGYVSIQDVIGKEIECKEYSILDDGSKNIIETSVSKTVGGEKNKLVIEPIGIIVIEFLIEHCESLFDYDYTKEMECKLDMISKKQDTKEGMCSSIYKNVTECIDNISIEGKVSYEIDEKHVIKFTKGGPVIEYKETPQSKSLLYPVKKDIDFIKLRNKEYTIEDVIETNKECEIINIYLGKHDRKNITVKNGKFGLYAVYNKENFSLKSLTEKGETHETITKEMVIPILMSISTSTSTITENKSVLRVINNECQLRKGQYGNYIFYQTKTMKKPKFINIKKTKDIDFINDDIKVLQTWIDKQI